MGPMQIKSDIDELDALLYAAFGSSDTRTIDWGDYPPHADIECEYYESEDELDASEDYYSDHPYEDRA